MNCDGQGQFSNTEVESRVDTKRTGKEESQDKETGTIQPDTESVVKYPKMSNNSPVKCRHVELEECVTEDDEDSSSTESSDSSTPTMTECPTDYDTDTTIYPDTDCEDMYGGRGGRLSDTESEHEAVRGIDEDYYDVITE